MGSIMWRRIVWQVVKRIWDLAERHHEIEHHVKLKKKQIVP